MILCIGNKRKNTYVKRINKLVCVLVLLLVCVISTVRLEAAERTDDTDVTNTASFSTDVIYQIVTDRFFDGNPSNNPSGDLFDPFDLRKYHGGDWAGITKKLQEGYFKDLGVSALWISSPVENIETIDPSMVAVRIMGIGQRIFFGQILILVQKKNFK